MNYLLTIIKPIGMVCSSKSEDQTSIVGVKIEAEHMKEMSLHYKNVLWFCQVYRLLHQACLDKVSLWCLMLDRWNLCPCFSPDMCQTDRQTGIFTILISPFRGTKNNFYIVFMCRGNFILAIFYYVLYSMSTRIKV